MDADAAPKVGQAKFKTANPFSVAGQRRSEGNRSLIDAAGPRRKGGFTILELLIVLSIVALMLGLVWPQMSRRISKSQLKQVTVDLQQAIADAREQAIRSGQVYELRFSEGGTGYLIGPSAALPKSSETSDPAKPIEKIFVGPATNNNNDQDFNPVEAVISRTLDPSYQLYSSSPIRSNVNNDQSQLVESTIQIGDEKASGRDESDPDAKKVSVLFSPDGRAEDFELSICDLQNRFGMSIRIRGLTGQAEIGESFLLPPTFGDSFKNEGEADENVNPSSSEDWELELEQ